MSRILLKGSQVEMPGLASAHSHAFQRATRGRTQKRASGASFWSWRHTMYQLAESIGPESMGVIAEFAFAELASMGVTAVGEFHYVHHDVDGRPYADRTLLSKVVIDAARRVGIKISLLRVLYERAGFDRPAEGAQRRFSDTAEHALADVEALRAAYAEDEGVRIGIAPHSIRAVSPETLVLAAEFAAKNNLPFHMHVSEQQREIDECLAEYGQRPIEALDHLGVLSTLGSRFVGVHATHLAASEVRLLKDGYVCVCRTTERDLGDGTPLLRPLDAAGARLCMGVDSHAISDPFEELRAMELDERCRLQERQVVLDGDGLLKAGHDNGYAAIGLDGSADSITLDADDPSLRGCGTGHIADAVFFGASGRAVSETRVDGKPLTFDIGALGEKFDAVVRSLLG